MTVSMSERSGSQIQPSQVFRYRRLTNERP